MAVEQVSVDILRILGLDETDEIDMQSYKGYLREKLVEISMGKGGLSRDEEMSIRDEFQRVRGSYATKVKKTKVNAQAVFNRELGATGGLVKYKPSAPGSIAKRILPQQKAVDGAVLDKIYSIVLSIQNNLISEDKRKKKEERDKKSKKDKEEKTAKESSLEKVSKGIVSALEKTFKPVLDIFKRIRDALILLFLGWTANRLLDWIKDPSNLKTFNAIVDFLARNAGKLLLLFVMINNPLVKVVRWLGRNMISFLVRMIADLTKGKGLLKNLRLGRRGGLLGSAARVITNPGVMATAGVIGGAALANEVTGQRKSAEVQAENKARSQSGRGLGLEGVGGVGDLGSTSPYGTLQGTDMMGEQNFDDGGVVKGPSGIDKVRANLTEGEVVFSKPAVNTFGEDFLLAMNKLGGGTNRPTYSGGRMYAAGGGLAVDSSGGGRTRLSGQVSFSQLRPHHGTGDTKRAYGITKDYVLYSKDNPNNYDVDVPSPVDATVKFAGDRGDGYGKSVELLDRNEKPLGLFGHLNKLKVSTGQKISAGKSLGIQGYTGSVSPPGRDGQHLHIDANPSFHEKFLNYITSGKAISTSDDSTSLAQSPEDATKDSSVYESVQFSSESERKLVSSYLKYITQPMGRGLDIRPTIDQVTGIPGVSGPGPSPQSIVPSRSAASSNAERVTGAASRQIATPS